MFNNDLPFDPINLQVEPISFTINQPPYLPQSVDCPDELAEWVPQISALLANEIQSRATANQTNFLRIFMYNQCAMNNFHTEAFDELLQSTIYYVIYILTPPYSIPNPSFDNAIKKAVPEMVYMMAANNCRVYPAMGNEVPANMTKLIRDLINQYDTLSNEIGNMKNGGQKSRTNSFGNSGGFGGGGFVNNNSNRGRSSFGGGGNNNSGNSGFGASFGNNSNNNTSRGFGSGNSHTSSLFSKTTSTSTSSSGFGRQMSNNTQEEERPANVLAPKAAPKQQPQQQAKGNYPQPNFKKGAAAMEQQQHEDVGYMDEKWVPSPRYPYFPAFNPNKVSLTYRIQDDGSTTPILKQHNPEMDYNRHAAPTSFGKINDVVDLSKTAETLARIQKGALHINSEAVMINKAVDEGTEMTEPKVYHAGGTLIATSITEGWLNLLLKRAAAPEFVDVYRGNVVVVTPMIVREKDVQIMNELSRSLTYIGLREQMASLQTRMSPELYYVLNKRMAQVITRSVRQELGIPELAITDFVNDLHDIQDYIETEFGKNVLFAFRECQETHIQEIVNMAASEVFKDIEEAFYANLEFPEGKKPLMIGLNENYSLTLLNCNVTDLELELGPDGIGSSVTEELTPQLYQLVKGIFESPNAQNQHRFLIRTNDGRVLEARKGALGEDHLLLSLVE